MKTCVTVSGLSQTLSCLSASDFLNFCKEKSPLECKGLCSLQCDQTWTTISRPVNRKYGEAYMRGQSKVEVDTSGSLSGPTPPVAFCTSGQQPLVSLRKGKKHDRGCRPAQSRESEPQEWFRDRAHASPPRSATRGPPALAEKKIPTPLPDSFYAVRV